MKLKFKTKAEQVKFVKDMELRSRQMLYIVSKAIRQKSRPEWLVALLGEEEEQRGQAQPTAGGISRTKPA